LKEYVENKESKGRKRK